jgi:hypothetical protein
VAWAAAVLLAGSALPAQNQMGSSEAARLTSSMPAQDLVRRAIQNEEKANNDNVRFMYRLRTETPKGSRTQELVETNDGVVARLIAINDKPLTPEQRQADDQKLERLLTDSQERAKKQKAQKEDEQRVSKMVRSLPDAFSYQYDGTVPGKNGGELIRLKFTPNPRWTPPDRERQVFQGMNGTMLIDPQQVRLAKIEATLFRDVNFGWGIFGHLDRGGQFIVEQSNVGDGRWESTDMRLRFTGKILLFKSLNINEHESASNFRPVPDHLTFAQGVELLKKHDGELAEKHPTNP